MALALVLGASPLARAQPDSRREAREAFARALAAENREDWHEAIAQYEEAYRLAPHPDVLYNLGAVYERLGEARAAAEHFERYLAEKPDAGDRAKVERKLDALRVRPSRVAIASAPAGAVVIVDGVRRGTAPIEVSLPGGTHQLVAELRGERVSRTIALEYGEPLAITLPVVAPRGILAITSNVVGAPIVLDGVTIGATPWTGPVEAGTHVVVVTAPGYTRHERTVEVPADGNVAIEAGLGRPLGYVEPPASRGATVLLGVDGGTFTGIGVMSTIWYGYRSESKRAEIGLGTVLGAPGVGFATLARGYVATGRLRPYVELELGLAGRFQTAHVAGGIMLADLPIGRAGLDLFIEAGIGVGKLDGAGLTYVPIIGGISSHLLATR